MNPSDPTPGDDAFAHRLRPLPRPVLRGDARQRSLAAALAAAEAAPGSVSAPRRPRFRLRASQWAALAACWALSAYFRLSAPPAPGNAGAPAAGGYAVWPGLWPAAPDDETARLLATLYPRRFPEQP